MSTPPYPPPRTPERPEKVIFPAWWHPLPIEEDVRLLLKKILDKLDSIEKRLEKIERLLTQPR